MISYLVVSTLCMGVLLIFYHTVLEKEKTFQINRAYLIFSLLFSLVIPIIPVGVFSSMLPWSEPGTLHILQSSVDTNHITEPAANSLHPSETDLPLTDILFWSFITIYIIVTGTLFVRLLNIVHIIQMKVDRHQATLFNNIRVVLVRESIMPHTFLRTIFVNRRQYERGEIKPEILQHEYTHARQLHSLDILFVELLKTVMWFNPVLYFYKKAMLLNHEFIADEAVLSAGGHIKKYQQLLFNYSRLQF